MLLPGWSAIFKAKNMHCRILHLLIAWGLAMYFSALSAQTYRLFHYTALDGLPNTLIKGVAADEHGLIWLATDGGLIRYDGLTFESFRAALPTPFIKDVLQTSDGRLLASTDKGLFRIQARIDQPDFQPLLPDSAVSLAKSLYEDENGAIWTSNNSTIFCIKDASWKAFDFDKAYHSDDFVKSFSIVENGFGQLYAFSRNGALFVLRQQEQAFSEPLYKFGADVNDAIQVAPGKIWAASNKGIFELTTSKTGALLSASKISGLTAYSLLKINERQVGALVRNEDAFLIDVGDHTTRLLHEGLEEQSFTCLFKNELGNLWVGTDNGLTLLKRYCFTAPSSDGLAEPYIQAVEKWGTQVYISDGGQIFRAAEQYGRLQLKSFYRPAFHVYFLLAGERGLWLAGEGGQVALLGQDGSLQEQYDLSAFGGDIYNISKDASGGIWFCQAGSSGLTRLSPEGALKKFGPSEGLDAAAVDALYFEPVQQALYAGGSGVGRSLFRYNVTLERFENISPGFQVDTAQTFRIIDLAGDEKGGLLIGTTLGLFRYHFGSLEALGGPQTDGVSILALSSGERGDVWYASAEGLNLLRDGTVYTFTNFNGLPSKTISWRCLLADDRENIWVGTSKGVGFAPSEVFTKRSRQPVLTKVESSAGSASVNQRRFNIKTNDFLALELLSVGYPNALTQYHIRRVYQDSVVESLTKERELLFSDPPASELQLEVRARQSEAHSWSEPLELEISASPLWSWRSARARFGTKPGTVCLVCWGCLAC